MPCLLLFLCLPICINSAGAQGHHTTPQGHTRTATPWECTRAWRTHAAFGMPSYFKVASSTAPRQVHTCTHTHTRACTRAAITCTPTCTHPRPTIPWLPATPRAQGTHPPAPIARGHCKTAMPYAWASGTHAFSQHLAHTSMQFAMFSAFCSTLHQCLNPDISYLCTYEYGAPTRQRSHAVHRHSYSSMAAHHSTHTQPLHPRGGSQPIWQHNSSTQMIRLQVHLQTPCYDFSFL